MYNVQHMTKQNEKVYFDQKLKDFQLGGQWLLIKICNGLL